MLYGLGLCLLVAGCANYKLGSTGPLPFHSLYVATVKNNGYAPQAQAPVTEMLRQSLLQEGNLELKNQGDADATLEVTLTDYHRTPSAMSSNNTLNVQAYNITLSANCTLVDNRNGTVYFKNLLVNASIETYINGANDLNEPEYQSMPLIARELARKIKDVVVSTW